MFYGAIFVGFSGFWSLGEIGPWVKKEVQGKKPPLTTVEQHSFTKTLFYN